MSTHDPNAPMRIRISDEARARLRETTQTFLRDDLDLELSDFQTDRLLDFFVKRLGAPVYNQAIQDARGFVQEKLDDLDGEFYEPIED